jgi:O-antigen/teichoic acid export membrane protein
MSIKQSIGKNILFGIFQLFVNSILMFAVIRIFIINMGVDIYGIYSLLMVIGNVNNYAAIGINLALIKYLAEKGKGIESDHCIIITLVIHILIILPVSLVMAFFNQYFLHVLLGIPLKYIDDAKIFFIIILVANLIIYLGQTFTAILDSQQKIYYTEILQLIYNIVYWGLIYIVISFRYPFWTIGLMILISSILWIILTVCLVYKIWGALSFVGLNNNFARIFKNQFSYGSQIFMNGVVSFFYEPITKVLLSNFIGVSAVGFLDIGLKVRNLFVAIINKLIYPLFPIFSQTTDRAKNQLIIRDVQQMIVFLIIPIVTVIISISEAFTRVWIGHNVHILSVTIAFICSGFLLFSSTVGPYYNYLIAKGKVRVTILLQIMNVMGNCIIFLLTYIHLGYYAIIAGNVGGILISFMVIVAYQKADMDILIIDSCSQAKKLFLCFLINLIIGFSIKYVLPSDVMKIIIIPIAISIITLMCYRYLHFIKPADVHRFIGNKQLSNIGVKILCRALK